MTQKRCSSGFRELIPRLRASALEALLLFDVPGFDQLGQMCSEVAVRHLDRLLRRFRLALDQVPAARGKKRLLAKPVHGAEGNFGLRVVRIRMTCAVSDMSELATSGYLRFSPSLNPGFTRTTEGHPASCRYP